MSRFASFLRDYLTPLMVLAIGAVVAYDHFVPREAPEVESINGATLGKKFARTMAPTFADGWLAAANALEQGKSMADAQAALQTTWQTARSQSFAQQVGPEFSRVLPEGAEPTDPTQRAAVVRLWRDFARGLKGER